MCLAYNNQHLQAHFVISCVAFYRDPIPSNINQRYCFSILEQVVDRYNFVDQKNSTKRAIMGELNTYKNSNSNRT